MRVAALLLTALAVVAARDARAQGTGEWIRADGSAVYMSCPHAREYGARTRIPASCRVAYPGILYTVKRDARAEADAAELAAAIDEARELRLTVENDRAVVEMLQRNVTGLAAEHETIAAQLEACERRAAQLDADRRAAEARERSFSWGDAAIGAGAGAVVAGLVVVFLVGAL